jgi:hypothetical protein
MSPKAKSTKEGILKQAEECLAENKPGSARELLKFYNGSILDGSRPATLLRQIIRLRITQLRDALASKHGDSIGQAITCLVSEPHLHLFPDLQREFRTLEPQADIALSTIRAPGTTPVDVPKPSRVRYVRKPRTPEQERAYVLSDELLRALCLRPLFPDMQEYLQSCFNVDLEQFPQLTKWLRRVCSDIRANDQDHNTRVLQLAQSGIDDSSMGIMFTALFTMCYARGLITQETNKALISQNWEHVHFYDATADYSDDGDDVPDAIDDQEDAE